MTSRKGPGTASEISPSEPLDSEDLSLRSVTRSSSLLLC
uniref:Uncharacterized protein n=1 Tax=Anguilla anguilla TaxID=7936 RepID=A0A0E9T7Z9_ANGAN